MKSRPKLSSVSRCLRRNTFRLRYKLFSGFFSGSLCSCGRRILRRTKRTNRRRRKIAFPSSFRTLCTRFSTFCFPILVGPIFKRLLRVFSHSSLPHFLSGISLRLQEPRRYPAHVPAWCYKDCIATLELCRNHGNGQHLSVSQVRLP